MYIVGTFNRNYFDIGDDSNPMGLVGFVNEITKDHLQRAASEDDYQVINILKREYFDPKQNKWVEITDFN